MRCRHCQSMLFQRNALGEPIIRTRGIVRKPDGFVLVCPRCKAAVPVAPDFLLALDIAAGASIQAPLRGAVMVSRQPKP
jgi:hypothetical protein